MPIKKKFLFLSYHFIEYIYYCTSEKLMSNSKTENYTPETNFNNTVQGQLAQDLV